MTQRRESLNYLTRVGPILISHANHSAADTEQQGMSFKRASPSDPNRLNCLASVILIKLGLLFYDATFHINHLNEIVS